MLTSEMNEFDRLIATYFEQVDAGEVVDPHAFIVAHPIHSEELRDFFANLGVLDNFFGIVQGASQSTEPLVDRIGDFLVVRELGRGGMGIVYEAEEVGVERRVALKVLYASSAIDLSQLTRFQNEVRVAASLSHDHIVPMYSVGVQDGTHFFAMKLIEGASLAQILKTTNNESNNIHPLAAQIGLTSGSAFPATESASWSQRIQSAVRTDKTRYGSGASLSKIRQGERTVNFERICKLVLNVARALHHAHSKGIVHRDVKPSNLLIDHAGKVWVTDFGLAHLENEATLTATGDILGTAQYMSPEQAQGSLDLDHRSDVYSLGVVLYQLLTGELPFRGKKNVILHQIINHEPVSPRSLNAAVNRDLETICVKCLQKRPQQRYLSTENLADDLARYVNGEPISARPIGALERTYKWCHRHKAVTSALAVVAICVTLVLAIVVRDARRQLAANQTLQTLLHGAEQAKLAAQARTEELRIQTYGSDIKLAYENYQKGWVDNVDQLLEDQVPASQESQYGEVVDLRGFEWQLLSQLNRRTTPIVMPGRYNPINDIAVFQDGKKIATVSDDSVIRIWDVDKRKMEFELRDERLGNSREDLWSTVSTGETAFVAGNEYLSVAVSPDNKYVATGNLGLTLWNLESRTREDDVLLFPTRIDAIAFSPDGQIVAAHSRNELLKIAHLNTGRKQEFVTGYGLHRLNFSPDGKRLAVPYKNGDDKKGLYCIDTSTGEPAETYPAAAEYRCPSYSSDGRYIFAGTYDDDIHLIDTKTGQVVACSPQQRSAISDMALSADDQILAATYVDGTLIYWHLPAKWKEAPSEALSGSYTTLMAHAKPTSAVRFVDNSRVVTSGKGGSLKMWDLVKHEAGFAIDRSNELVAVTLQLEGAGFWGASSYALHLFECNSKISKRDIAVLSPTRKSDGIIYSIALCPMSRRMAVGTSSGTIVIVNSESGEVLERWRQDDYSPSEINDLAFSPDGKWLANSSSDHTIRVRSTKDWQEKGKYITASWGSAVAFSNDSRRLAYADRGGELAIVHVGSWKKLCFAQSNTGVPSGCLEFTPEGDQLLTGHLDSIIRIWDADTLRNVARLQGHQRRVSDLTLHPDGKTLASCSTDQTVRLWYLPTLSEIGTIERLYAPVTTVVFSQDATKLIGSIGNPHHPKAGYRIWETSSPMPAEVSHR